MQHCVVMGYFFILNALQKCCLQFVSIWTSLKFCRLVMVNLLQIDKKYELVQIKAFVDNESNTAQPIIFARETL